MKKILILIYCAMAMLCYAQPQDQLQQDNTFAQAEKGSAQNSTVARPGNPGDPLPIDQDIPYLLVIACAIIFISQYRIKSKAL